MIAAFTHIYRTLMNVVSACTDLAGSLAPLWASRPLSASWLATLLKHRTLALAIRLVPGELSKV